MKRAAGDWIDPHFGVPVMLDVGEGFASSGPFFWSLRDETAAPTLESTGKIFAERPPWICPKCSRGLPGDIKACDHGGVL